MGALAEVLEVNTTLRVPSLYENSIRDAGAALLEKALIVNKTLMFNLGHCIFYF